MKGRSPSGIIQSAFDVKRWLHDLPPAALVRPAHCPHCDRASRPPGAPLRIHGHGLRWRQQRGPGGPDEPASIVEVRVRRYRCRDCGRTLTVVPQGIVPRKLFSAGAIGLALCLWAMLAQPAASARAQVSPWHIVGAADASRWRSLRRWIDSIDAMFRGIRASPGHFSRRQQAERAAACLCAAALPGVADVREQVFAGAVRSVRGEGRVIAA